MFCFHVSFTYLRLCNARSLDLVWIFFIILVTDLHIQDAHATFGEPCQNTSVCDSSTETCVFDEDTGTCKCSDGYYEFNVRNPYCLIKVAHGEECEDIYLDVCKDSTTKCLSDTSGLTTRCLCNSYSYYKPVTKSCSSLEDLRVKWSAQTYTNRHALTLNWVADKYGTNVTYDILSSPVGGRVVSRPSENSARIHGLLRGTEYNFTITSVLQADDLYPEKTISETVYGIWTKSAPVRDLKVDNITSNSAIASWRPPSQPHGEILGYDLYVREGVQCVFGYIIRCPDCPSSYFGGSLAECRTKGKSSKTLVEINDETNTVTAEVPDLQPSHEYIVVVSPYVQWTSARTNAKAWFKTVMEEGDDSKPEDQKVIYIIVGVTAGAIIVGVIIVIAIVILRRKRAAAARTKEEEYCSTSVNTSATYEEIDGSARVISSIGNDYISIIDYNDLDRYSTASHNYASWDNPEYLQVV